MAQQPRVAVCLSGQPRAAKETFYLIMNNIIRPNNADVFIHMNYDAEHLYMEKSHADNGNCKLEVGIDKWVIENYKPVRYLVEKPRDFKNQILGMSEKRMESYRKMNARRHWNDDEIKNYAFKQLLSMYYSIYKVNEIKELYMLESGIHYDYVFRLRFDITPRDVIRAQDYEPNFIYYLDIGQPDNLISDWLNFGSNAIMNIYASVFLNMEYLNTFRFMKKEDREENNIEASDKYSGVSEFFIRDIMYLHKIPKRGIKTNCFLN
jgi:hypothetical protein